MRRAAYWNAFRGTPAGGQHLTLVQQLFAMAHDWPQFTCRRSARRLICRGLLRPRSGLRKYLVRIEYVVGLQPVALVESPALEYRAEQDTIPHTYPPTDAYPRRPCLHHPADRDWTPAKTLARTILPWLLSWLLFYELWLASGSWLGGGHEPGAGEGDGVSAGSVQ